MDDELNEKRIFFIVHLGLLSLGASDSLRESSGALFAFSVPLISVSKEGATERRRLLGKYDNLLTTVPDKEGQIRVSRYICHG